MKRKLSGILALLMTLNLMAIGVFADGRVPTPADAPSFSTYTAMSGVAFDPAVAGYQNGASYKALWEGKFYSFTVGTNVFATFTAAYQAVSGGSRNVFALSGELGNIQITGPVQIYGYYYNNDPNVRSDDSNACPTLNPAREEELESKAGTVQIAAGTTGTVAIRGLVLQGTFEDASRAISTTATNVLLENWIVRQKAGVSSGYWVFNINNANNSNMATTGAGNCDSFTLKNCRLEQLTSTRICGNCIPPVYTVDGLVTVTGTTVYYGFPQWRRYFQNAVFNMTNCYFQNFSSPEGKQYFMTMEGLNKYNGLCTIRFADNVFKGDASSYPLAFFVKTGYDIEIQGNTFISNTLTAAEAFYWNISYDQTYPDYLTAADVSTVNLSDWVHINGNRFVGYTKFTNKVNNDTTINLTDNFFTNNLSSYRTAAGSMPQMGTGYSADGYRANYAMDTWSHEAGSISFDPTMVLQEGNRITLLTSSTTLNLYDYGMVVSGGATPTLSSGETLDAISLNEGANLFTLHLSAADGGIGNLYTLVVYANKSGETAINRLQQAMARYLSDCYTESSVSGYAALIDTLRTAIENRRDISALLTQLNTFEAALQLKSGVQADFAYYDLFPTVNRWKITNTRGWRKLADVVNAGASLYGHTVSLEADLDFKGAAIVSIGGAYADANIPDNPTFFGTFEGNHHTIKNFVINQPDKTGVGLFGRASCAVIRNLRVGSGTITGFDKVGAIAGFADGTLIENCSNAAAVIATDGANGIAGITSQARRVKSPFDQLYYSGRVYHSVNYGPVTTPKGRACGTIAWGQSTAQQMNCINYGTLNGPAVYAFGQYSGGTDLTSLVVDCYYAGAADSGPGTPFTDVLLAAWNTEFAVKEGLAVFSDLGTAVYRARLQCSNPSGTYDDYGMAGTPVHFDLPGYFVGTVTKDGSEVWAASLMHTADITVTGAGSLYQYTISYQLNGGSFTTTPSGTFTVNDTVQLPSSATITKSGMVFEGWYETSDFSSARLEEITAGSHKDYTLYAKYVTLARTITTAAQLVTLANDVNAGNTFSGQGILLSTNISMSGVTYPVIGSTVLTPFKGVFAGNGKTISNLSVSGKAAAGVIGTLGVGGIVSNLTVSGSVSGCIAGGIVGINMGGVVEHCTDNCTLTSTPTTLKIISQNVRINSTEDLHGAADRHTPLKNILLAQSPDIIGFQEADATWQTYLPSDFSGYSYIWTWRGLGGNNTTLGKEATPIFYKTSKFDLLSSGTFWLSSTPTVPSYCFNESMNRIATWAKLRVKATGEVICYFNTHFPLDEDSRNQSVPVLRSKVEEISGGILPTYITADFNMYRNSAPYNLMSAFVTDLGRYATVDATNNSGTINGFTTTPIGLIDFCFGVWDLTNVPYYKVILDNYTDSKGVVCPPSDHYGIYLEVRPQNGSGDVIGINKGTVYHCS